MSEQEEEIAFWQEVTRKDFHECMVWVRNLCAFLRSTNRKKAQQRAALRRIANLRASLDGLEVAIKKTMESE